MTDNTTIPLDDRTTVDATRAILEQYAKPAVMTIADPTVPGNHADILLVPAGLKPLDVTKELDRYLARPRRLTGTSVHTTLDSLIDHVNEFQTANSVLFANDNRQNPALTVVYNYNKAVDDEAETPVPEFGDYRAHYAFPLSDEWKAWQEKNGKPMSMAEFAEFLEDRVIDVLGDSDPGNSEALKSFLELTRAQVATPGQLLALSTGLKINESSKVASAVNLGSGTGEISFISEHQDEQGEKLKVPNVFLIGIPVFRGDTGYRLAARLRYRKNGPTITFWYDLWRADVAFDDAFTGACKKASGETELKLYYGKPE